MRATLAAADGLSLHLHDRITLRLARFIVDGGKLVRSKAPQWVTPTLLLYAGADRCVTPRGSDAFAAASQPAVLQAHRYDGFAHEIFNEPGQARVLADLTTWLSARLSAGLSAGLSTSFGAAA